MFCIVNGLGAVSAGLVAFYMVSLRVMLFFYVFNGFFKFYIARRRSMVVSLRFILFRYVLYGSEAVSVDFAAFYMVLKFRGRSLLVS